MGWTWASWFSDKTSTMPAWAFLTFQWYRRLTVFMPFPLWCSILCKNSPYHVATYLCYDLFLFDWSNGLVSNLGLVLPGVGARDISRVHEALPDFRASKSVLHLWTQNIKVHLVSKVYGLNFFVDEGWIFHSSSNVYMYNSCRMCNFSHVTWSI